jgi:hypothetical protein
VNRKLLILIGLLFAGAMLGYIAFGPGLYYWKEHAHHYEPGAYADLFALHTIQENYKNDHGEYAGSFSQLGVPLGGHLDGDSLEWDDGPYRFRFVRTIHDRNGKLAGYEIEARAGSNSGWRWPTLSIDEAGKVHR